MYFSAYLAPSPSLPFLKVRYYLIKQKVSQLPTLIVIAIFFIFWVRRHQVHDVLKFPLYSLFLAFAGLGVILSWFCAVRIFLAPPIWCWRLSADMASVFWSYGLALLTVWQITIYCPFLSVVFWEKKPILLM